MLFREIYKDQVPHLCRTPPPPFVSPGATRGTELPEQVSTSLPWGSAGQTQKRWPGCPEGKGCTREKEDFSRGAGFKGSAVKNPPAMQETQETWVRSLCWEDPLEEGRATHSSILAWRLPGTEEPGGLQFLVSQGVGND